MIWKYSPIKQRTIAQNQGKFMRKYFIEGFLIYKTP